MQINHSKTVVASRSARAGGGGSGSRAAIFSGQKFFSATTARPRLKFARIKTSQRTRANSKVPLRRVIRISSAPRPIPFIKKLFRSVFCGTRRRDSASRFITVRGVCVHVSMSHRADCTTIAYYRPLSEVSTRRRAAAPDANEDFPDVTKPAALRALRCAPRSGERCALNNSYAIEEFDAARRSRSSWLRTSSVPPSSYDPVRILFIM